MTPQIRLACQFCDTDECDGVAQIPDDWTDVHEVQTYADACQPIPVDDPIRSPFEWYTHLGTCPDCQKMYG